MFFSTTTLVRVWPGFGFAFLFVLLISLGCSRHHYRGDIMADDSIRYGVSGRGQLVLAWEYKVGRTLGTHLELCDTGILATSLDGHVKLLSKTDGGKIWSTRKQNGVQSGCSVAGSTLVFAEDPPGNKLYCFDTGTGEKLWEKPTLEIPGAPVVDQECLYTCTRTGVLSARNLASGRQLWSASCPGPVRCAMARQDSLLFLSTVSDTLLALSTDSGKVVWSAKPGGALYHPPVFSGDLLWSLTFEGVLTGWQSETGRVVHRYQLEGNYRAGLAVYGNQLFAISLGGTLSAIDLETGAINWFEEFGVVADITPTVHEDLLWIPLRTGALHARRLIDGRAVVSLTVPAPITAPILAAGAYIYIASGHGHLVAFRIGSFPGEAEGNSPDHDPSSNQINPVQPVNSSDDKRLRFRDNFSGELVRGISPQPLSLYSSGYDPGGGIFTVSPVLLRTGGLATQTAGQVNADTEMQSGNRTLKGQMFFSRGPLWTAGWLAGTALALWFQAEADSEYETYLHTGSVDPRDRALENAESYDRYALISWGASEICFILALRQWLKGE